MSAHTAENDGPVCWRSECRGGCYYPQACSEKPDPCIAPPGNLCLDTGCWDADRCIVNRVIPPGVDHD
jgi:hypothetical protein